MFEDAATYVQELFRTNAGGHDADHTMRVYRNTLRIAENEPDCDVRIAELAALLHDADEHGRSMADSVQHFYDRLLRLKELMNTETGRQMAQQRHAFLEAFLREYFEEEGAK